MSDGKAHADLLTVAYSGMMIGAFAESIGEMAKELRRYAGGGFDKCLDDLERRATRSIENAAIDGFSENDQLFLVEQARAAISAKFRDIRSGT
ncbi:MAG: hypothetical protein K9G60_12870 [Pseudolabrys sp.]|nr:hypothetical protein [Pseudolabrys sp.]